MTDVVLRPAKARKTTTLCPSWFFGGPHCWLPDGTCEGCGKTLAQVRADKAAGRQPKLACEDHGHVVERLAPRRPRLALVVGRQR